MGVSNWPGGLDLEAFAPRQVDLRLSAKALPLTVPDTLELLLNGDLRLSGTPENSNLRGTLTLIEGLYFRDVNLSPLRRLGRRPAPAPAAARSFPYPFLKNLGLDVAVTHRSPFVVDNNLAYLEVTPDLRIGGTLERPLMDGRIQVPSGTITYYNRNFTVVRGVVDFVSPYRIEPIVALEGETQVRTWRIHLAVSGPLDNPRIRLDLGTTGIRSRHPFAVAGGQNHRRVDLRRRRPRRVSRTDGGAAGGWETGGRGQRKPPASTSWMSRPQARAKAARMPTPPSRSPWEKNFHAV